ncbi:MAG: LapA family protein [Candidatus Riflebacteria bacterium]|nr:LapA family protein [Candidatus Riflebacteria bacterium]
MRTQLVIFLLICLVLILLALQNPNPVKICCFKWETEPIPLITVILVSLLAGVFLTVLFTFRQSGSLKKVIFDKENEIEKLKKKLIPEKKVIIKDFKDEA